MKKEIFAIPIFEDKVDLKKIEIPEMVTEPTWDAGVPSTFAKKLPSFLMHMVNSGNEGTTISGNVYMEYQ